MKKKLIVCNFLIFFAMALFPFLLLLYSFSAMPDNDYHIAHNAVPPNIADYALNFDLLNYFSLNLVDLSSTFLAVISCSIIIVVTAVKDNNRYKITPMYSLLVPLGALFLVVCCTSIAIRPLVSFWNNKPHLIWRDREYS